MFYGIVLVSCNVVFTLVYWSESLVEIPFFHMRNGLLVFGISILQALSPCYPALLLSVTTLNVIAASVVLFMAVALFTVEGFHWVIIEVALILTACASIDCVICTFFSTFDVVRKERYNIKSFLQFYLYCKQIANCIEMPTCQDRSDIQCTISFVGGANATIWKHASMFPSKSHKPAIF
uniref:Uncharacterized protein n=1 Tax=Wuchereria bancrofti TaxID=6293 RepID=A0AAF5Q5X6_WUCBA